MRMLWIVMLALAVTWGTVGCGEDDGPGGQGPLPSNNGGNNGTPDAGTDADAVAEAGTDADASAPDADSGPEITELCDGLVSMGALDPSATNSASGNTADGTQLVNPSCGASDKNEVVFEFTADQPMRVNASVQSQDVDEWVLALYRGSCDAPTRVKCKSSDADTFIVEAGETYYLSVETGVGATDANFSLALEATRLDCAPVGSTTCDGDRVTHCEVGFDEVTYDCAYACDSGACGADVCDNALVVSDSGSTTFSGSYLGYASNFNFQGRSDCSASDTGVNTPGQDLVFSLPGLNAGQEVSIDASADTAQNGIFVMEGCSAQEACVTGGLQVDEVLDWTVPSNGDYHVVIDLIDETDGDFEFTITR